MLVGHVTQFSGAVDLREVAAIRFQPAFSATVQYRL